MNRGGYASRFLSVSLAGATIETFSMPEAALKAVIGGSGLGAWLFLERFSPLLDPLSPDNPLLILNGPLAGTGFPGSSRFTVCAKSPLTGIWGEAAVGGNFGPALRRAGYDGILFLGRSPRPAVLVVEDGRAELREAGPLWGQDVYRTTQELKAQLGTEYRVFCIGPAGENRVRFAAIANDGAHFAGRTGMGAVMGLKNLKAVAVRGGGTVPLADEPAFHAAHKATMARCKDSMLAQSLHQMGTDGALDLGMMTGDVPIRNWQVGQDPELAAALGGPTLTDSYLVHSGTCAHCPIGCKRVVKVPAGPYAVEEGPGPEYETCCTFGSLLANRDLAAVIKANELCNRLGLDTISCGATIAWAMECFERGLLTRQQADGLELGWGNMEAVLALLPRIAVRQGFGDLLAEGSVRAAGRIGGEADCYAIAVKGLELPMHDPRAFHGMGLAYAYSSRGGCHNQHSVLPVEQGMVSLPELGLEEDYAGQTSEGKPAMVVICENYGLLANCLCQCHFVNFATAPADLLSALNAVTGWAYSLQDLLTCGERVWHLKRGLINLMGVRDDADALPERLLAPLPDGGAAGSAPDLPRMKREYQRLRGLSEEGLPRRENLERLGLQYLAMRLYGGQLCPNR